MSVRADPLKSTTRLFGGDRNQQNSAMVPIARGRRLAVNWHKGGVIGKWLESFVAVRSGRLHIAATPYPRRSSAVPTPPSVIRPYR